MIYKTELHAHSKDISECANAPVEDIVIAGGNEKGAAFGAVMAEAQIWARDAANEPGNVINPVTLAEKAKALAAKYEAEFAPRRCANGTMVFEVNYDAKSIEAVLAFIATKRLAARTYHASSHR